MNIANENYYDEKKISIMINKNEFSSKYLEYAFKQIEIMI